MERDGLRRFGVSDVNTQAPAQPWQIDSDLGWGRISCYVICSLFLRQLGSGAEWSVGGRQATAVRGEKRDKGGAIVLIFFSGRP